MNLRIQTTWNGEPALEPEPVSLELDLELGLGALRLELDAPFFGDPPPPHPAGSTPGLWDHEVVEVFLFAQGRYLEVELGPHGHHLVFELEAPRSITRRVERLEYAASIAGPRWRGRALIPLGIVPPRTSHVNAHAVHGAGSARRYLSAGPRPGERPDFHRKDAAIALDPALAEALRR